MGHLDQLLVDDEGQLVLGQTAFHNHTTVHPVGLAILLLLGIAMLALPRRRAMIPVLLCASFIAVAQRVVVFSLDFNFLRIIVLFGWARILLRQEYRGYKWKTLDYCVLAWATSSLVIYPISHGLSGIIYKLGVSFESLGMYFIIRILVRDLADVSALIDALAIISVPVACFFAIEWQTHRNPFSVFGGVPEITMIRQGKLRCQGAYAHPILAGCYWAAIFPLLIGRITLPGRGRILAAIGAMTSLAIVGMCSSSTPVVGVLAAIVGFVLFPVRGRMSLIRWATLAVLICLHMVMNNPVWHLIARTDLIGGSTGWHRFNVIDQCINHFHEWVLFGRASISHWNIFMNDITNQYVLEAVRGGGLTLLLFLTMTALAFGNIGRLWRSPDCGRRRVILVWALGVSLAVHTVNFMGVSYFGQIDMLWYTNLALTAVVPAAVASTEKNALVHRVQFGELRPASPLVSRA